MAADISNLLLLFRIGQESGRGNSGLFITGYLRFIAMACVFIGGEFGLDFNLIRGVHFLLRFTFVQK